MNAEIVLKRINQLVKNNSVLLFSNSTCAQSKQLKDVLDTMNVEYTSVELDLDENGADLRSVLANKIRDNSIPQVFMGGDLIGNFEDFMKSHEDGLLDELLISLKIIK